MEPPLLLLFGAELGEDLGVARVRSLVAEDDRAPHRSAFDLVHEAELHLAVALAAQLGGEVRRPEPLLFDLFLQRPDGACEAALVHVEDLERVDLFVHETAHPLELCLELGLGGEVPGHSRPIPVSIMATMVSVNPSYMGSGRRPL